MSFYYWMLISAFIVCLKYETVLASTVRKLVYQKDMSEYCRRRVIPSVFIGRHVMEANAQILHFSKLEVPYSCFISVRSESGNKLILVIQFVTDQGLVRSCTESNSQLLVYEMGETFGGYWGPLSDTLLRQERVNKTKFYTLRTTQPTTTTSESLLEDGSVDDEGNASTSSSDAATLNEHQNPAETGDLISVELPIVNVSGRLVPGEAPPKNPFDVDDAFEFIYDVAPRRGTQYETSMVPLVQFSIKDHVGSRRGGDEDAQDVPKYQLDYNVNPFTPDTRLTYTMLNPTTYNRIKLYPKQKYNANRRLNFKKDKTVSVTQSYHKRYRINRYSLQTKSRANDFTRNFILKSVSEHHATSQYRGNSDSWELIENLMRKLSKTTALDGTGKSEPRSRLLQKISSMKHNFSAYLAPNLSIYDVSQLTLVNVPVTKMPTTITYSPYQFLEPPNNGILYNNMSTVILKLNNILSTEDSVTEASTKYPTLGPLYKSNLTVSQTNNSILHEVENLTTTQIISQDTVPYNFDKYNNVRTISDAQLNSTNLNNMNALTGSLVDHESWENVVQSAPVMAVLLNQTFGIESNSDGNHSNSQVKNITKHNVKRKKRYIHSIPILNARPRFQPTTSKATTSEVTYNLAELHDFVQLVELQDDEMFGRVALRNWDRYVGPALFNICNHKEGAHRQVFMFNSSRIVIAISNFTLERMAVVVTAARAVAASKARCARAQLECQVSGARVCIDASAACDGVPNCGSYDIYDEDRLMCGAAKGLQHNVYLAAITFMAVVLTVLYTVHHWLKRCVPKVSDAFFVYTNGAENVLYLDSIMRSPNEADDGDGADNIYHQNMFGDDVTFSNIYNKAGKSNIIIRLKRLLLCSCLRKKNDKELPANIPEPGLTSLADRKRIYSFTELEIRKMIGQRLIDTAVQTGDSLEMKDIKTREDVVDHRSGMTHSAETFESEATSLASLLTLEGSHHQHADELNIMKFLRDARSDSIRSSSMDGTFKTKVSGKSSTTVEEREIRSHEFDSRKMPSITSSMTASYDYSERPGPSGLARKHLRFDEETTMIPAAGQDEDDDVEATINDRRNVVLGVGKTRRTADLDTIEEDDERSTNTARDYKRFWMKTKRSKKK